MRRLIIVVGLLALGYMWAIPAVKGADAEFITIDVPGSTSTLAAGINDSEQIVGQYGNAAGFHGFFSNASQHGQSFQRRDSDENFTTIDVKGASGTVARSINDSKQIVGGYQNATGFHGFLDSHGKFTTLDAPGATFTLGESINSRHQIVGISATGPFNIVPEGVRLLSQSYHGFLYSNGAFTTFDVPGASRGTAAIGISDSGQIVGWFIDVAGQHGFLLDSDVWAFTTFDVPGASYTIARGINDFGQIVGEYGNATGTHGFLLDSDHRTFTTFDVPGASFTRAHSINDPGQIVGIYQNAMGFHGFFLDDIEDLLRHTVDSDRTFTTVDVSNLSKFGRGAPDQFAIF